MADHNYDTEADEELQPLTNTNKGNDATGEGNPTPRADGGVDDGLGNNTATATADIMSIPISFAERLHGLPLYLITLAFLTATLLAHAGIGLHSYTLYEAVNTRRVTNCVASLQEARDQVILARYATGVLLSYASSHVSADIAAMVDRPDLFLSLQQPSSAVPSNTDHLYARDGSPIVADGTTAQKHFLELSQTLSALNAAVDDAKNKLSGSSASSDTINLVSTAANNAITQALTLVRTYHASPTAVSSSQITALLALLDKCSEAMGRDAVSSVLSSAPQKWIVRLPILQLAHAQFARVVYAVDALRSAALAADASGAILATQPTSATLSVDFAATTASGSSTGPVADALPYNVVASSGVSDPRAVNAVSADSRAEYSGASRTLFNALSSDFNTVLNNAASTNLVGALGSFASPNPSFAPVFSALNGNAVDDTFHNQVLAAIRARRSESDAMLDAANSQLAQAIVSLVFLVFAGVASLVGMFVSWNYAQASVSRRAAFQRLVERHRAIEELGALKGLNAEVSSLHVPGWEEYNQLRRTGTAGDIAEAGVKLARSVNANTTKYRQKSISIAVDVRDPDLAQLTTSIRPKMLDRLRSTNTTAAKLGASIALGASQRSALSAGDDAASAELIERSSSAVYAVTRSLTAFAAKLSGAMSRLRAHTPQACFGDVEGDAAAAATNATAKMNAQGTSNGMSGLMVSGRQMITDIRSRELRHDRALHLCYCTVLLMDASALIPETEAATYSDLATSGFEQGSSIVRPAFVAMDRFLALVEDIVNGQDGLILGANGDHVGAIWNLVGQSTVHQTRAVVAAFALRNAMRLASVTALEEAETASTRLAKAQLNLNTAQLQNAPKGKIRRLERTVQEHQQRVIALKASAKWFKSRSGGFAVASSVLSAGTVAALMTSNVANTNTSQQAGDGNAAAGIIDRSNRSLDDAAQKAQNDKRQATSRRSTGKGAQNAFATSLASVSAPRWFEAVGPAFGLCHKMCRLNQRFGTDVLVTEDVCDAAHNAALNGVVLDAEASSTNTASGNQPTLVRRPVATLFQVHLGTEELMITLSNSNRRGDGAMPSMSGAAGKRSSDGRVMSSMGPGKTVSGQWTNIYSVFVGFENDLRASPEQWDNCFEELCRHLRKGNQPSALKALREYVDNAASSMAGGAAAAQASVRPSSRGAAARRMPTENDRVIKAWLEDLTLYDPDLTQSHSTTK